jgi:MerR family transcriptional regulator, light-induced transcriptional regulator
VSDKLRLDGAEQRSALAADFEGLLEQAGIAPIIAPLRCLNYLQEAVVGKREKLFLNYVSWCHGNWPAERNALSASLAVLRDIASRRLVSDQADAVLALLDSCPGPVEGTAGKGLRTACPSLAPLARNYLTALLARDRDTARRLVFDALERGTGIKELYLETLQCVQHEIGRLWHANRISVADEHFCTAVTQSIMIDLYPRVITARRIGKTLISACVGAELHEMGIRMVTDFFEMSGWDSYYLGSATSNEALLAALEERKPDLVALSATMTHHVAPLRALVHAIRTTPPPHPAIMVGGLPFNASAGLCDLVGADLWAPDAEKAVSAAAAHFGPDGRGA